MVGAALFACAHTHPHEHACDCASATVSGRMCARACVFQFKPACGVGETLEGTRTGGPSERY